MRERHWLIVYDIRDAKRLRRVEKCVESYGWRVQKSVFESFATDEVTARLKRRLEVLTEQEDFVLFFPVCERDWQKQESYGLNARDGMPDGSFLIL